jgi:hypothetical protein
MERTFWAAKIEQAWREKSVVWLTGVRRAGKSTLCQQLTPDAYFDCELPRVRKLLEDPEEFFLNCQSDRVTLDEIHRLDHASEVLKIAADHFPKIHVIATGSSTLSATKKFKDTLTDRKRVVFLPPMTLADTQAFGNENTLHRMQRGGLPPFFLAPHFPEKSFQEWIDSFWAKDIEELFQIEKKGAFLKFFELLSLQSGGMFEAKSFAAPCGVSHTTIATYLNVMAQTHIAYVLRPFHRNPTREIISAPKVYFFDTGFMTYFKGSDEISAEEKGRYWEHLVLNELLAYVDRENIHYWRDKSKNEVDFVVKLRGRPPIAIECKWSAAQRNDKSLLKFREIHPDGENLLVAADLSTGRIKKLDSLKVQAIPLHQLSKALGF